MVAFCSGIVRLCQVTLCSTSLIFRKSTSGRSDRPNTALCVGSKQTHFVGARQSGEITF